MSRRTSGTRVFVGGLSYRVRERDLEKFFQKIGRVMDISMKNGYAFVEFDDYRDADDAVYELNGKELMGERVSVEHAKGPGYRRKRYQPKFRTPPRPSRKDKVSVEKARGTPRGSDVWRGSGRPPRDYGPPPPRRRSRGRDRDSDHRNNERYGPPTRTDYRLIVENLSSRVSWQDLKDYMRQAGEVTYADAHKQRRNEGVVEFASYSDMKNAMERLDDTELNGRRIRLVEDKHRRRSRGSSSSRSRSRSRSRDRSKSRSRSSRSGSRSRSKSAARSRSKSASPAHSKSRSPSAPKKRSRSRSTSVANHKRTKRSESESSDKRSRSVSRERNGRSDGSADEDD